MSTVDYINKFVEYFLLLIEELKKFFESLTGKAPVEEEKKEEENLPL